MSYKSKLTCLQFSLVLNCLLFWLPGQAQKKPLPPPSPYNFEAVDQLFKQNQKTLNNNFVVLVWKDSLVYQQQGSPDFTAKTPAPIAGAGTWLTAALVMTYVDEGKISLDDKVTKYIPLFGKYMKGYITIRNCLTNTTGIQPDPGGVSKVMQKSKYESLEAEVESYASKRDIVTNPGTEFYYNNVGPNIAARILEIVTKKSFDRLMMERILRPLKMRGTSFTNEEGGALNPAGGARSTANDYINFLVMLLNKGQFGDKRVLSEKAVAEMETAQLAGLPVKFMPKNVQSARYGLGNFIMESGSGDKPSVLSCPNMLGTTPYIDKCRNYAAILLVLKPDEEQKKDLSVSMKNLIDEKIPANCK